MYSGYRWWCLSILGWRHNFRNGRKYSRMSQFYHVSVDNEEPYNVYGGLQDNNCVVWSIAVLLVEWRHVIGKSVGVGDGYRVYATPNKKIGLF